MKSNKPTRPSFNRGFTLIELLAVLGVIGVLAAILMPALADIRRKGWHAASASNIRQLVAANKMYASEHGRYAPNANRKDTIHWHGRRKGGEFDGTGGYLSSYLEDGKVRQCPVLENVYESAEGAAFDEGTGGYGYNATYIGGSPHLLERRPAPGASRDSFQPWWTRGNLPARIEDPAATVMFTSTAIVRGGGIVETGNSVPYRHLNAEGLGAVATPTVHFRFDGRALVAWADGHVSFEPPNEVSNDHNVYGDNNEAFDVGWFGETEWNGPWNPRSHRGEPW